MHGTIRTPYEKYIRNVTVIEENVYDKLNIIVHEVQKVFTYKYAKHIQNIRIFK